MYLTLYFNELEFVKIDIAISEILHSRLQNKKKSYLRDVEVTTIIITHVKVHKRANVILCQYWY